MDFCVVLQARLGSKRFPEKILKNLEKKITVLDFQIYRFNKHKCKLVVATTKNKIDDKLIKILKKKKINFFRGSETDVYSRYKGVAKKFKIKNIIRITSDCPLVDFNLLKKMKNIYIKSKLDYIANTLPIHKSHFPNGSDIEIFKSSILDKVKVKSKSDKEHVTNIFWKNKFIKKKTYLIKKNLSHYRYTLDYKEDLEVLREIYKFFFKKKLSLSVSNICKFLKNNKRLQNKNSHYNKIFQGKNV